MPDSAAADAGLREGDVITLVDGRAVSGAAELRNLIGLARADDEIEVTYIRDRQEIRQRIRIRAVQAGTGQGVQISDKLAGALFEDVDEFTGREGQPGVRAVEVTEGSPAWQAGLRPSDLILSVNRQLVFSLDDLAQAVKHSARGLLLNLRRGDSAFYLVIP
tara:strand:- start:2924 stop:3409 length:486 start_codon:yes stop_codon:yes gene_type:complete